MSLPKDTARDPREDALLSSVLHAADGVEAGGCPDADVLGLFAERALEGAEFRAVEAHVEGCPRCQAVVAAVVRALPDEASGAGAEAEVRGGSAGGGFGAWFAGWRWLVPATSLAAVALVAVWVGREPAGRADLPPAAPVEDAVAATPGYRGLAPPQAEALVPSREARGDVAASEHLPTPRRITPEASARLERQMPPRIVTSTAAEAARPTVAAPEPTGAATTDARAKSAAPPEMQQQTAGLLAERAAAANATPPAQDLAGRSGGRAASVEEALRVAPVAPPPPASPAISPAAPAARAATLSALAVSPWRAVDGRVERSRDNGATWQRVPTPQGVRVIAAGSSGGDVCWLVVEDGVLRTTDGRTWTRTRRPTTEPLAGVVAVSADRASVFTASGARWETANGGRTWAPAP